jgi:hypothetical protein
MIGLGKAAASDTEEDREPMATRYEFYRFRDAQAETPNGMKIQLDGKMFTVDRATAADGSKGLVFIYELWDRPITHPHEISRVIADPTNWALPVLGLIYREDLERLVAEGKAEVVDKEWLAQDAQGSVS